MKKLLFAVLLLSLCGCAYPKKQNTYIGDPSEPYERISDSIDSVKIANSEMPYQKEY